MSLPLSLYESSTAIVGDVIVQPNIPDVLSIPPSVLAGDLHATDLDSYSTVYNHSLNSQGFYVVPEQPQFTSHEAPEKVYSVVYEYALPVTSGSGLATFILKASSESTREKKMVYVITGYSDEPLDQVSGVFPTDTIQLRLYQGSTETTSSCCTMTMPEDVAPAFAKTQPGTGVKKRLLENEIQISTDDTFSNYDQRYPFLGLGVRNRKDTEQIIPVCFWGATPSTKYRLQLSTTWYCFRGDERAGHVCDIESETIRYKAVFSDPGQNIPIIYNSKGTFEPYHK